jgi:hypothetical protein
MTQSKADIVNKWAPIIESVGITGSKANWMAEYAEMHSINEQNSLLSQSYSNSQSQFPSLLPMATKVASQTVGLDLVSVQPIGGNSQEEIDRINAEIKAENREGKIESILEDKEYKEKTIEDHPDYKNGLPSGQLFYMDYTYGHKKTRRAGKKHKNKNGK